MSTIKEIRKKAVSYLLASPFLKKNRCYTLKDASLDVDLIFSHILKTTRTHLITSLDDEINEKIISKAECLFKLRYNGLSLAYIMEEKEFYGLSFYVNQDVLIPKADTELLVEKGILAINELKGDATGVALEGREKPLNILDVFSGSGCIAISIAMSFFSSYHYYTLIDISQKALNVAKQNAKKHLSSLDYISFCEHDALQPFPLKNGKKYDLILANPPYVPTKDVLELLSDGRAEPRLALDGGEDGLAFYHALAKHSFDSLSEKGILLSEIGDGQSEDVVAIFKNAGFSLCVEHKDLSGEKRVVEARKML